MFSPVRALREREAAFETIVCSSGQHSELLSDALSTLGLEVDHDLGVMRHDQEPMDVGTTMISWVAELCRDLEPDVVLVQGDTMTTMAAGLGAFYSHAAVAHVEAGLRTYDNDAPWPEEANRRIVGAVADLHFAPTELAASNLLREGVASDRVHVTGNTGIDALHWVLAQPRPAPAAAERRVVITAHRRESIPDGVEAIARAVRTLARRYTNVRFQFVLHPAPAIEPAVLDALGPDQPENIDLVPPCGYVEFVHMLAGSFLILTDSGGIQEEAPALGKPVLVVNRRTERQEAVAAGTAQIVGTTEDEIVAAATRLFEDPDQYRRMATRHDPYGDGQAGERIAGVLVDNADFLRRPAARQRARALA